MNVGISTLKVFAMLIVYICHCYIICKGAFGFEFSHQWQAFLQTPAWAGVWIFVFLSGFLAGKGFISGRYVFTKDGMIKYMKGRIVKVLLPTWIFISLAYILLTPDKPVGWETLLRFLTCTFNGHGGTIAVGASWYVFVVMWLYALTPLFVLLLNKLTDCGKDRKSVWLVLFCLLVLGLIYRIFGRMAGLLWYDWIYANVLGCLDLYVAGIIVNYLMVSIGEFTNVHSRQMLYISAILLFLLVNVSSLCYYYGEGSIPALLSLYRYIFLSFYLLLLVVLLVSLVEGDFRNTSAVNKLGGKIL